MGKFINWMGHGAEYEEKIWEFNSLDEFEKIEWFTDWKKASDFFQISYSPCDSIDKKGFDYFIDKGFKYWVILEFKQFEPKKYFTIPVGFVDSIDELIGLPEFQDPPKPFN